MYFSMTILTSNTCSQIVDHTYRILNINAKFPGSAHDSYIWRMCAAREHLQNVYRDNNEWILWDSGYPLEPWLIIPIADPQNEDHVMFNTLHAKACSTVERAIGLLKARWRCLCKQRMLHYSPTVARRIINACAAMHNFCAALNDDHSEFCLKIERNINLQNWRESRLILFGNAPVSTTFN